MKVELLFVLVVCCAAVHGKSLQTSNRKRELLLKALEHRRGLLGKRPPVETSVDIGDFQPNDVGRKSEPIKQIQEYLEMIIESLDSFKEEYGGNQEANDDRQGNQGNFQEEIDSLALEIQIIESKLDSFPQQELQTSVVSLVFTLKETFGQDFFDSVWEIYNGFPRDEAPISFEENETTGNDVMTPADRLSKIATQVRRLGILLDQIINGDWETDRLVQSIIMALSGATSGGNSTTPTTPVAGSTTTQGQTNATTTVQPTEAPTTTTSENIVAREKQALRRRLTELLLRKILQNK